MNKKKSNKGLVIIASVLMIVMGLMAVMSYSMGVGLTGNSSKKKIKTYNSIESLKSDISFELDFPSIVYEQSNLVIKSTMRQIVEIKGDTFVLKAGAFVDVHADPLGLYDESSVDNEYTVKSNNTNTYYLRYRQNYPSYENCTIINWCTQNTSYGILLGYKASEDEILGMLGITKNDISKIEVEEKENTEVENGSILTKKYTISDKYEVNLPKFESSIQQTDYNGMLIFSIEDRICFVFIYDNNEENSKSFGDEGSLELCEGLTL